jgi:hypothetical protein
MNNPKSYLLAAVGILFFVAGLALNLARANSVDTPTVVSSTAHFSPNRTYMLTPTNGAGQFKCKVIQIDGVWLKCEGEKFEWVNTDAMMYVSDSR